MTPLESGVSRMILTVRTTAGYSWRLASRTDSQTRKEQRPQPANSSTASGKESIRPWRRENQSGPGYTEWWVELGVWYHSVTELLSPPSSPHSSFTGIRFFSTPGPSYLLSPPWLHEWAFSFLCSVCVQWLEHYLSHSKFLVQVPIIAE